MASNKKANIYKNEPHKTSIEEILQTLDLKIRAAEKVVVRLKLDADEAINEVRRGKLLRDLSTWMTRRRTLIEVWEHASNVVWTSKIFERG